MARDRSAVLLAAVAALMTLAATAGCGGSKGAAPPASAPPPAAPAPPAAAAAPTSAELHSRLLTLADLPPGFVADEADADVNGTMSATDPRCRPMTDLMNSQGHPVGAIATAQVSFTRAQFGPTIGTGLAGFPTPEAAQTLLAAVTGAMRTCTEITETDKDGSTYDFLVSRLPFPATGDASGAIRVAADVDDLPAQVDLVLVRVGNTLLYVADSGFGDSDPDLTRDVVSRAVAKVERSGVAPRSVPVPVPVPAAATESRSVPVVEALGEG